MDEFHNENMVIQKSANVKFLGLILDEHLNWNAHLLHVLKKLAPIIGALYRLRHILSSLLKNQSTMVWYKASLPTWIWSGAQPQKLGLNLQKLCKIEL